MRKGLVCLLLLMLVMFSCKHDKRKMLIGNWHVVKFENNLQMITGNWQAVKLENPEMDDFFRKSQLFIDTLGKANDAATNLRLYGSANMDSIRHALQVQYDSSLAIYSKPVTNTSFNFTDDGIAVLSFNGNVDTSTWYVDSSGALVLHDMNQANAGDHVKMEIISVSDSVLKLRFRENNSFSTVTFRHSGERAGKPEAIPDTWFNFRPDSVVQLTFGKDLDSSKWFMLNDSVIVLRSFDKNAAGDELRWGIMALSDNDLVLKIIENSSISTLTFLRVGK